MKLSIFGLVLSGFYLFGLSLQVLAFIIPVSFISFYFIYFINDLPVIYYLLIWTEWHISNFEIIYQQSLTIPALLTNINI